MAKPRTKPKIDVSDVPEVLEPYHKGISVDQIRELVAVKGLSHAETAKILGCDRSLISRQCQAYGIIGKHQLASYKAQRADIFASKHAMMMDNITAEKAEKAPLRDLVVAQGILYDKERLERDLSTGNFSVISAERDLAKLNDELAKLEGQL